MVDLEPFYTWLGLTGCLPGSEQSGQHCWWGSRGADGAAASHHKGEEGEGAPAAGGVAS